MDKTRRKHDGAFKGRVVLEAIRGQRTIAEIAHVYGVHPNQITTWKRQVLEQLPGIFSVDSDKRERSYEEEKGPCLRR